MTAASLDHHPALVPQLVVLSRRALVKPQVSAWATPGMSSVSRRISAEYSTCFFAIGSYFRFVIFSVIVRLFLLVT